MENEVVKYFENIEVQRSGTDDLNKGKLMFRGVAIRYSQDYQQLAPNVMERVHDTLLDDADMSDVRLNFNHVNGLTMLARSKSGTLRFTNDKASGVVSFEADVPDTTAGRDLAIMVERGDVSGCSFSILLPTDGTGRTITKREGVYYSDVKRAATLKDLCITDDPAYKQGTYVEVIKRTADAVTDSNKSEEQTPVGSWDFHLKLLQK